MEWKTKMQKKQKNVFASNFWIALLSFHWRRSSELGGPTRRRRGLTLCSHPPLSRSPQTTTPSACTLRYRRQPEPTRSRSSPKWTIAKVTENKYPSRPFGKLLKGESAGEGGVVVESSAWIVTACVTNADPSLPLSDQDLYDYIEPNPDEGPALSECDGQQSSHVSCIKVFTKSLFICGYK